MTMVLVASAVAKLGAQGEGEKDGTSPGSGRTLGHIVWSVKGGDGRAEHVLDGEVCQQPNDGGPCGTERRAS